MCQGMLTYQEMENRIRELETMIDKQKQSEAALIESETRYRNMFLINPDVQFELDANGCITMVSPHITQLTGLRPEELVGRRFQELLSHDDRTRYGRSIERRTGVRATEALQVQIVDQSCQTSHLELKWVEVSATGVYENGYTGDGRPESRGSAPGFLGTQGAIRDLTGHKQAEEECQRSCSVLQAVLESTFEGILAISMDGTWTCYNKRFIDMWRIPASIMDSCDSKVALEFMTGNLCYPEVFLERIRHLKEDTENITFDTFILKDGRIFEQGTRPQRLGDRMVGQVLSFRDVTEREKAES